MEQILTKEIINRSPDGVVLKGIALLRSLSIRSTSNGGNYAIGTMEADTGSFTCKIWDSAPAFLIVKDLEKYIGKACIVEGKSNIYNGVSSIFINNITLADPDEYPPERFMEVHYSLETLHSEFKEVLDEECSDKAKICLNLILKPIFNRYKEEFGAIAHHDACRHGLYAHSKKVTQIARIVKMYPEILRAIDPDTLFVGCAIHDIGKVLEYDHGGISSVGRYTSHLTLGIGLVTPHKDKIIELKGEVFYNDLLSIISQHHGDFGEKPRTVAAYVVHLIDALEASMTSLQEIIASSISDEINIEEFAHLKFRHGAVDEKTE